MAERSGRQRSGSIVKVEVVGASSEAEVLDQSGYPNLNVEWVDQKGAWLIHPILILSGKLMLDTIPGVSQQMSWTLTNLFYIGITYLVFHWATGIPFHNEMHSGAYDELTLWEQIDEGAQYTPAKKWLVSVPIVLFLISTHYTNYNPWIFALNVSALVFSLVPKLPQLHRHRVRFLPSENPSGAPTPGTRTPVSTKLPQPPLLTSSHFKK